MAVVEVSGGSLTELSVWRAQRAQERAGLGLGAAPETSLARWFATEGARVNTRGKACEDEREVAVRVCLAGAQLCHELSDQVDGADPAALDRVDAARDRAVAALQRFDAAVALRQALGLVELGYRDELTGALTRSVGLPRLFELVARAALDGTSLVLAVVNVDGLRRLNQRCGYLYGDQVLAAVGSGLRAGLGRRDLCVRLGGDELVCSFLGLGLRDASEVLRDVQQVINRGPFGCSVGIGLAHVSPGERLEEVLGRADEALTVARTSAQPSPAARGVPRTGALGVAAG